MAHPWMTFFILMSVLSSPLMVIKIIKKDKK